jgi:hypothetical protein
MLRPPPLPSLGTAGGAEAVDGAENCRGAGVRARTVAAVRVTLHGVLALANRPLGTAGANNNEG